MSASSSAVYQALRLALDDEYRARATCAAVIDRFGPVRPFVTLIQSEQRQINTLQSLLRRRGWPVPGDPYGGLVEAPASLDEASRLWARAELDSMALYDRLGPLVADDDEVSAVFGHLHGS